MLLMCVQLRNLCPNNKCCAHSYWENLKGAHKQGLKPQIFRENRAKFLPGKWPDWSLFRAYRGLLGLIGADASSPHSHGQAAEIPPKGPFWAQLAPFGLSPRLLSPRLDFLKIMFALMVIGEFSALRVKCRSPDQ